MIFFFIIMVFYATLLCCFSWAISRPIYIECNSCGALAVMNYTNSLSGWQCHTCGNTSFYGVEGQE